MSTRAALPGHGYSQHVDPIANEDLGSDSEMDRAIYNRFLVHHNRQPALPPGAQEPGSVRPKAAARRTARLSPPAQHAATSTSFYLFDEGSAIPDKISEVA
jgi:hypothetical protein